MRNFICILILYLFLFSTSNAYGMDAFLGKIVSVNPEKGIMQVKIIHKDAGKSTPKNRQTITVKFNKNNIPAHVKKNEIVRFWGKRDKKDMSTFQADSIRGYRKRGHDPTGVRSRLGRGRRGRGFRGKGKGRGKK